MITWALISCAKKKAKVACEARFMYQPSPMFRGAMLVAGAAGQRPLILSAKYGLLQPDQLIEPYDETLIGKSVKDREEWARQVLQELGRHILPGDSVVSYLGRLYGEFIIPEIRQLGITVAEPLAGLGQGKRLKWFKARRAI